MSSISALKRARWVMSLLVALVVAAVLVPLASAGNGEGDKKRFRIYGPIQVPQAYAETDPLTTNIPYVAWRGELVKVSKCIPLFVRGDDNNPRLAVDEAEARRFWGDVTIDAALNVTGKFRVQNWTGSGIAPQMMNDADGTVLTQIVPFAHGVAFCWNAVFNSEKAGLAEIKMTANLQATLALELGLGDNDEDFATNGLIGDIDLNILLGPVGLFGGYYGDPVIAHDFLSIWMTLNKPSLAEVKKDSALENNAGKEGTDLIAYVTGSFPMGDKASETGLPSTITLPNDWTLLGNALAIDGTNAAYPNNPLRWDIHDDQLDTEGHPWAVGHHGPPVMAGDDVNEVEEINGQRRHRCYDKEGGYSKGLEYPLDAVDNRCGGKFQFSTVLGFTHPFTIGPFDPIAPSETLLSDGKFDNGDAPMPSARLDFTILDDTKNPSDNTGSLTEVSKLWAYGRDLNEDGDVYDKHELYAPYYATYLPATDRGQLSSGITAGYPNNFPGFLKPNRLVGPSALQSGDSHGWGAYWYWDFAAAWMEGTGGALVEDADKKGLVLDPDAAYRHEYTNCMWYKDYGKDSGISNGRDLGRVVYRPTPYGYDHVAVYTDEHGEARVHFDPGYGAYFDAVAKFPNNGGCDLQGVSVLGTADIVATAHYPYQIPLGLGKGVKSDPVHKVVTNLFNKALSYEAKDQGTNPIPGIKLVTAWVTDIDGQPNMKHLRGHDENTYVSEGYDRVREIVCFDAVGANANIVAYKEWKTWVDQYGRVCTVTNYDGNATVEVRAGANETVTVIADFIKEDLKRVLVINMAGAPAGGTPQPTDDKNDPVKPGSSLPKGTPGVNAPTSAQLAGSATAAAGTGKAVAVKKAKLIRVKVAKKLFKNFVVVKVDSPNEQAKIRVKIFNRFGKVVVNAVRTVETGIELRVPNLKVPASARAVKVSVIA